MGAPLQEASPDLFSLSHLWATTASVRPSGEALAALHCMGTRVCLFWPGEPSGKGFMPYSLGLRSSEGPSHVFRTISKTSWVAGESLYLCGNQSPGGIEFSLVTTIL